MNKCMVLPKCFNHVRIRYFGASYDAIILTYYSKIRQSETRTRPYVMSNSSYEIRHNFQHNSELLSEKFKENTIYKLYLLFFENSQLSLL